MSGRPKRSTAKTSNRNGDMLGLSRQEERMLQRAMYDSLKLTTGPPISVPESQLSKDQNNSHITNCSSSKSSTKRTETTKLETRGRKRKPISMMTRSKSISNRYATLNRRRNVSMLMKKKINDMQTSVNSENRNKQGIVGNTNLLKAKRRGKRYSPMRRVPLSEMLRSLEDRKTQINVSSSLAAPTATTSSANNFSVSSKATTSWPKFGLSQHRKLKDKPKRGPGPKRTLSHNSVGRPPKVIKKGNLQSLEDKSKTVEPVGIRTRKRVTEDKVQFKVPIKSEKGQGKSSILRKNHTSMYIRKPRHASIMARSCWLSHQPSLHKKRGPKPRAKKVDDGEVPSGEVIQQNDQNGQQESNKRRRGRAPRSLLYHPKIWPTHPIIIGSNSGSNTVQQRVSRALVVNAAYTQLQKRRRNNVGNVNNANGQCNDGNNNIGIAASGSLDSSAVCSNIYHNINHSSNCNNNANGNFGNGSSFTNNNHSQNGNCVPPELWLDPKGQPVRTEDFINFLLYRETPHLLDPQLRWFECTPSKRKQRFFKVVSCPECPTFQTQVSHEKRNTETTGSNGNMAKSRVTVVRCSNTPRIKESVSQMIVMSSSSRSPSNQSSNEDLTKLPCPASVVSSCPTQAAVEENGISSLTLDTEHSDYGIREPTEDEVSPVRQALTAIKSPHCPTNESRSTHIMTTRQRR